VKKVIENYVIGASFRYLGGDDAVQCHGGNHRK
jgi:hypothetical protein